jgi:hypothetical protein
MRGLPKSYIKKYGITKRAWAEYRASKKPRKTKARKGPKLARRRRRSSSRRRGRSRSNKWGIAGTVVKLAIGAYLGNWVGGQIASRIDKDGTKPLYRAGGALAGAILLKKLLGRSGMGAAVGTGAAAMLAGHAALDFEQYMKSRNQNGG